MKILINTVGSRGDIQPFLALGKGLQAAGHQVALCTAQSFQPWVEEHGLAYAHMDDGFYELMQAQTGRAATESKGAAFKLVGRVKPIMQRAMADMWAAAQTLQPDALIFHPKALGSFDIAEKLRIPLLMALPLPLYTPTAAYPAPALPALPLGAWYNRASYRLLNAATAAYAGPVNEFRTRTLGLAPRPRFAGLDRDSRGAPVPVLYGYSRHVLPAPADYPPHVHVTGTWFLDRAPGWQPDPALVDFLAAGPPPVYVGFGSMGGSRAAVRAQVVLEALRQAGRRGVLASGWGGLSIGDLPPSVFLLESAPHDWLFPQMAAVVHHGGAGTVAAGLRAGKPTVVVPFLADQPFWGRVLQERGVSPAPIPQSKLTAANLAAAITEAVSDPQMRARAAALGEQIRAEDGVGNAVRVIEAAVAKQLGSRSVTHI